MSNGFTHIYSKKRYWSPLYFLDSKVLVRFHLSLEYFANLTANEDPALFSRDFQELINFSGLLVMFFSFFFY